MAPTKPVPAAEQAGDTVAAALAQARRESVEAAVQEFGRDFFPPTPHGGPVRDYRVDPLYQWCCIQAEQEPP